MAYSSNQPAVRGFLPPQNDDEKRLMRRAEELCQTAEARSMPRYSGFLSDREQVLAQAAINRCGCGCAHFWGGFENAERKVLCVEPADAWQEMPVEVLKISAAAVSSDRFEHRELLGAILGLGLERSCIGDLILMQNGTAAIAFVLQSNADFIVHNLTSAGRCPVHVEQCNEIALQDLQLPEPELHEATVPSLRADTVLAAMMHTSRTLAAQAISGGRVEINHVPMHTAHETVFAQDIFTVRGVGRYRLQAIGGKSKKDRIFISFYQY